MSKLNSVSNKKRKPSTKPVTLMGRPEKPIDWELVDKLLEAGCLGTEIAPHFDMHPKTFYERVVQKHNVTFTEYSLEKCSKGDSALRSKQFEEALKGDKMMLIWLGKQRLAQKDKSPEEIAAQSITHIVVTNAPYQIG